ncbi:MAG: phosphotransferase [Rubrivivax sp.]|nr:phosphotransferase [Rubrivivax sp.]
MSSPSPTPGTAATEPVSWPDAAREVAFKTWLRPLEARFGLLPASLVPASADASFRRYLRVQAAQGPLIIMDAPAPLEDVRPFVHVAGLLQAAGLHVPEVLAEDAEQGFLLLEDLGSRLLLNELKDAPQPQADRWMREATDALVRMQTRADASSLPPFDEALLQRELDLFPQWCVQREFGLTWDERQQQQWQQLCRLLIDSALAQPTVFVHRDWMPRNLMICTPNPGVLDFQDAVRGPLTYDIACQLRDAFHSWDEALEIDWAVRWWQAARQQGLPVPEDFGECWRQIEWMGMQRHLKVAGIFCRLKHRDHKPRYASDLPRFFDYLTKVAMRYRPLQILLPLIQPLSGRAVQAGYTF